MYVGSGLLTLVCHSATLLLARSSTRTLKEVEVVKVEEEEVHLGVGGDVGDKGGEVGDEGGEVLGVDEDSAQLLLLAHLGEEVHRTTCPSSTSASHSSTSCF